MNLCRRVRIHFALQEQRRRLLDRLWIVMQAWQLSRIVQPEMKQQLEQEGVALYWRIERIGARKLFPKRRKR
jgi:hypothetical protein